MNQNGILPDGFSSLDFEAPRRQYLAFFDGVLDELAEKKKQEFFNSNGPQTLSTSDLSWRSLGLPGSTALTFPGSFPLHITLPIDQHPLPYAADYVQLSCLGKGGFGTVYKVRNILDNQEYAVKRIVIKSSQLRRIKDKDPVEVLLSELRALARMDHHNIVKYHHGWVESIPASLRGKVKTESLSSTSTTSIEGNKISNNFAATVFDDYSDPFERSEGEQVEDEQVQVSNFPSTSIQCALIVSKCVA